MTPLKVFINKIPCVIWTPIGYDSSKKNYPWVVAFSGQGEIGNGTDADLTSKIVNNGNFNNLKIAGDKYGFLIVMPQLVQSLNNWVPGYTSDYDNVAIDYTLKNYPVDPNRMYITGLSLGGGAVWEYITSSIGNANKVAAAIPICGTPQIGGDYSLIAKSNLPVWAFHALDDTTIGVAATRNAITWTNNFQPNPLAKYTEYKTGNHYIWGTVYNDQSVYEWMLAQVNNNVVPIPLPVPEQFQPTNRIVRADGTSELVRIENL